MPALVSRAATQSGDGPTLTLRSAETVSRPQRSGSSMPAEANESVVALAFGFAIFGLRSVRFNLVARSRATPSTDQASGRFPSTVMSKTTSAVIESASMSFTPTTGVIISSRIMRPW